jgi:hypothetical protein
MFQISDLFKNPRFGIWPLPKQMKYLIRRFARQASKMGIHVIPYRDSTLRDFTGLPVARQKKILFYFRAYYKASEITFSPDGSKRTPTYIDI